MSDPREADRDNRPDSRALVPVPPSERMPSRVVQQRLFAQVGELGEHVTDLVLRGEIREFVLVSPYVSGGEVGKRITSPIEITEHPYRVIFFPTPHLQPDQQTFLIAVSVAYERDQAARRIFGFTTNTNQIERHGLFLIQFPRRNFPDAMVFSQWLQAWSGRLSYHHLDILFPDTSEFGYDSYQEGRGFKRGELAFAFDSVYPPNVKPTEHIGVSFTASERGPIKIIVVDNEDTRALADMILMLNSTVGSEMGRAAQIIAAAEKKGGEVGDEILAQVVGQHLETKTIAPEELGKIKATLDEVVEECKTDPRRLDMLRRAALKLLQKIHPNVLGAKYNQEVVSLVTAFNQALGREVDLWARAQKN